MIPEINLLKIIKYATKAPSGHNTQPWKFRMDENSVEIIPDFDRALPVADVDNHELYISLGCALENFKITANVLGYQTQVQLLKKKCGFTVQIFLRESSGTPRNQLFNCIERRQVRRNAYSLKKVPENILNELLATCSKNQIHIKTFTTKEEIANLKPFILEAAEKQFQNKMFVNELVKWSRFSEKEAMRKSDGIWTKTMGLPNMGRTAGNFLMKYVVSAGSEKKRWEKIIAHTAVFVLFSVEKNEPEQWIKLGEVFQRFGLTATKLGLSHAHVNMPCEEFSIRNKMKEQLNLQEKTPLLLIRIGYSEPMPYAFRRHLNELIINK